MVDSPSAYYPRKITASWPLAVIGASLVHQGKFEQEGCSTCKEREKRGPLLFDDFVPCAPNLPVKIGGGSDQGGQQGGSGIVLCIGCIHSSTKTSACMPYSILDQFGSVVQSPS